MQSEELLSLTASEPLSMHEENEMQREFALSRMTGMKLIPR
jgi:hypothetical protein